MTQNANVGVFSLLIQKRTRFAMGFISEVRDMYGNESSKSEELEVCNALPELIAVAKAAKKYTDCRIDKLIGTPREPVLLEEMKLFNQMEDALKALEAKE